MAKDVEFKVDNGRILVPVGQACRFACKYCYTRGGEVGPPKVEAEDILHRLEQFARTSSFDTIQFGYDGDPFDRPERGLMMLQRLAIMGKHMSFSTKARLDQHILQALANIHRDMIATSKALVAFISLSCWDSASFVEPHTPSPEERIENICDLKRIGIPAFIALRPVLPNVPDEEYERLAEKGIDAGCDGFILGPLYADEQERFVRFIPPHTLHVVPHQKVVVSWSAHSPLWTRYEDENRLHRLTMMIQSKGGRIFFSSVDAIEQVNLRSIKA